VKTKKKNKNFIMDTDWIFQGILDSEQKEYVLLNYFQKLNEHLEEMRVYPMFIELSLHLGNIQTLLTRNQMLYTDKKFDTPDDEIVLSDLKVKDIPTMNEEEFDEYRKILKYSQPKLFDYFNITKSVWSIVYDSITVNIRKTRKILKIKLVFFIIS
jgi:succinate dehydrogenase flavin-adding protein (antitoxin of CptAB toxin-antitoxin module)